MQKTICGIVLALALVVPQSGCVLLHGLRCCMNRWHASLAERTYCCDGCGEKYCNEWHSDPPACCEPCDNLGNYTGHDRSPWVGPRKGCPTCNMQ